MATSPRQEATANLVNRVTLPCYVCPCPHPAYFAHGPTGSRHGPPVESVQPVQPVVSYYTEGYRRTGGGPLQSSVFFVLPIRSSVLPQITRFALRAFTGRPPSGPHHATLANLIALSIGANAMQGYPCRTLPTTARFPECICERLNRSGPAGYRRCQERPVPFPVLPLHARMVARPMRTAYWVAWARLLIPVLA